MSHKATYWLSKLNPSDIKAGEFRVLFHLCDFHNDERDPEKACFPSQETLMEKTALSNGGLNNCLNSLEAGGFISRDRKTIPGTPMRRTYYTLGCDMVQTPLSGDSIKGGQTPLSDGAASTLEGGQTPPQWRGSCNDPVSDPVTKRETLFMEEVVPSKPKAKRTPKVSRFDELWAVYPKIKRKTDKAEAKRVFDRLTNGKEKIDPDLIINAVKRYAASNWDYDWEPLPTTWLNKRRFMDYPEPAPGTEKRRGSQSIPYFGEITR